MMGGGWGLRSRLTDKKDDGPRESTEIGSYMWSLYGLVWGLRLLELPVSCSMALTFIIREVHLLPSFRISFALLSRRLITQRDYVSLLFIPR